jgi:hypothetical protein
MSFLDPKCEHEQLGHVLASAYARAANATYILELDAQGKVEGLNLDQWLDIKRSYQAQMDSILALHRATCEREESK